MTDARDTLVNHHGRLAAEGSRVVAPQRPRYTAGVRSTAVRFSRSAIFFISEFFGDDLASYRNFSISCSVEYKGLSITERPGTTVLRRMGLNRTYKTTVRPIGHRPSVADLRHMWRHLKESGAVYTGPPKVCEIGFIICTVSLPASLDFLKPRNHRHHILCHIYTNQTPKSPYNH